MPKSSKKFILSTSQLNSYGFRMLTEGADLKEFKKNPIMLWMHNRALRGTKDEVLPLGYWDDVKIEGDQVTAVPVFDDQDEFAMSIYNKVENGTIRTCSAGAIPMAFSDEEKHLLPGQTRATVTKWKLKEASLTDFGSNPGALAVALYDQEDKLITLSEKGIDTIIPEINSKQNMDTIQLKAQELTTKLSLGADADAAKVLAAIDTLVKLNGTLTTEKATLETEKQNLQTKVDEMQKAATTQKIETLVDKAIEDRKITAAAKEQFVKLAAADFDSVEKLLNDMPAAPTVQAAITEGKGKTENLADKSWDELHTSNKLELVKLNHPEVYKAKFKEKFGKEPV